MRKVAYYLPNIHLENDIDLGEFRLLKAENWENVDSLIEPQVFGGITGTLIEVNGFSTGDAFSIEVDELIYRELEIIKFSYFSISVSNHRSFVANDTFEVFRIVEKNKDPSFEHKVCFSNGVDSFLMPLKKYFNSKVLSGSFGKVIITENNLKYYSLIKSLPLNEDDLITISIFNKTRNLYTNTDFIDRVLFARIATEKLAKKMKCSLKEITSTFLETAQSFVQNNKKINEHMSNFYRENICNFSLVTGKLQKIC